MSTRVRPRVLTTTAAASDKALGVDERVSYASATAKVNEVLSARGEVADVVPTEFLGSDGAVLTSAATRPPGPGIRLIARRPCLVLGLCYLIALLAALALVTLGNMDLTLELYLFTDPTHLAVQRDVTMRQLAYTNANVAHMYAARRLARGTPDNASAPAATEALSDSTPSSIRRSLGALQADVFSAPYCAEDSSGSGWGEPAIIYEVIYTTNGGSDVLSPKVLQRILLLERQLRDWVTSNGACPGSHARHCDPIDSALNYIYPSVVTDESCKTNSTRDCLRFDGEGFGADTTIAVAGARCEPALTQTEIYGIVSWMIDQGRGGFFSRGSPGASHEKPIKYVRSRIAMSKSFVAHRMQKRGLVFMRLLAAAHEDDLSVTTDFAHCNKNIKSDQMDEALIEDAILLLVAIALILLFMVFYFRNILFALMAILQISVSFPCMAFVVDVLFRWRPLSVFCLCALFVVTGVSSDNIFVVHETWRQSSLLRSNGETASVAERVRWTLLTAARPLIIADVTTAFSLFINCLSSLPAIAQFGLCGGLLIIVNFVLVIVCMPCLLVLEERGALCCGKLCFALRCSSTSSASRTEDGFSASRLTHSAHGYMFRYRRLILLGGVVLVGALVPSAMNIISERVGSDISMFSGSDKLPPTGLLWEGANTSVGGQPQLALHPFEPTWPMAYQRLSEGWHYRTPSLEFALWPSGAVLLACLLFADALAAVWRPAMCLCLKQFGWWRWFSSDRLVQRNSARPWLRLFIALLLGTLGSLLLAMRANEAWATGFLGCRFPFALNVLLAFALFLHALIFAVVAAALLTRLLDRIIDQRWFFGTTDLDESDEVRRRRRRRRGRLCLLLSIASFVGTGLVLYSITAPRTGSGDDANGGLDNDGHGNWIPSWVGVCLALLTLFWSGCVALAATASFKNEPMGMFLPLFYSTPSTRLSVAKEQMRRHFAIGGLLFAGVIHATGWTIFALSGYPTVITYDGARVACACLLFVTAIFPALLLWVTVRYRPFGILRPPEDLTRKGQLMHAAWNTFITALYIALGVLLLLLDQIVPEANPNHGHDEQTSSGSTPWKANWPSVGLFLLLVFWSSLPALSGFAFLRGERLGHFLPANDVSIWTAIRSGLLLFLSSGLLLLTAVSLLILAGYGLLAVEGMRTALGVCILLTAVVPLTLAYVSKYNVSVVFKLLGPTELTKRHSGASAAMYLILTLVCMLGGLLILRAEHVDGYPWALGLVWMLNAIACIFVVSALTMRKECGFIRRLVPQQVGGIQLQIDGLTARETRWTLGFSALGASLAILGLASMVISYFPSAVVFIMGSEAPGLALGITLVMNAIFPCVVLCFVFSGVRPTLLIFQQVPWAKRSRIPTVLMALLSVALMTGGVVIISRQSIRLSHWKHRHSDDDDSSKGALAPATIDALTFFLAFLASFEAISFAFAAKVQAMGRKWLCFRPIVSHRASPWATASLTFAAVALVFLSGVFFAVSTTTLAPQLWGSRALPLCAEFVMAVHVAVCAIAIRHTVASGNGSNQGVLGIFTLGHSTACAIVICVLLLCTCLGVMCALPFIKLRSPWHEDLPRVYLPSVELLASLTLTIGLFNLLSFLHVYREDLCKDQPQQSVATVQRTPSASKQSNAIWWRRCVLCTTVLLMAGSGAAYGVVTIPQDVLAVTESTYFAMLAVAVVLLLHVPPFVAMTDAWASGVATSGFAPLRRTIDSDGTVRCRPARHWGWALFAFAATLAFVGGLLMVMTHLSVEVQQPSLIGGVNSEANIVEAESCQLVFGVDERLRRSSGAAPQLAWVDAAGQKKWAGLRDGFAPHLAWQQEELRLLCENIVHPQHPVAHSKTAEPCLMSSLHAFVMNKNQSLNLTWPVQEARFVEALFLVLQEDWRLQGRVGFEPDEATGYPKTIDSKPSRVAWISYVLHSKYPDGIMHNPPQLDRYVREWQIWWNGLDASIAAMSSWSSPERPPTGRSVFHEGWATCHQFAQAPTLQSFLAGVTRALIYTPLFSLVAMFFFLRDVYLCYAALYTITAIIILVLGLLDVLGVSMGPIESLAFAVVIGVSVDYLVHFAYAFKQSIMLERYYKSRAVLLARSGSTIASGLTTLCAVIPLVFANMLPLRTFGIIFSVVALVSLGCAMILFNVLLMVTGAGLPMSAHSLPTASALPSLVSAADSGAPAGVLVPFGGTLSGTNTAASTERTSDSGAAWTMGRGTMPGTVKV